MSVKLKIKKGDKIVVTTGKDKGKQGDVIEVLASKNKVRVAGINIAKRHRAASMQGAAGIIDIEQPIHVSNVAIVDPKTSKATKVGYKLLKDGKKVRFARSSGEVIDN